MLDQIKQWKQDSILDKKTSIEQHKVDIVNRNKIRNKQIYICHILSNIIPQTIRIGVD